MSAEVARLERRGIAVTSIEPGPVDRDAFRWGYGQSPAELVRTTWTAHLGGALSGGSIAFRQSVWTYSLSEDPRDAGGVERRWSLEILPDSAGTARGLKRAGNDRDEAGA